MEAKLTAELPEGPEWEYEPKWDGFRCLAFRDGDTVELQSKSSQPLTRYFPEIVEALQGLKATKFVLDGELIVPRSGRLSFDDLLQRIHPAASRVQLLSRTTPARLVLFDILEDEQGQSLIEQPLSERRKHLDSFYSRYAEGDDRIALSRWTNDPEQAQTWLSKMRGQLDGIVAKRIDEPYQSGKRAMIKVKTIRSADCVVGGFRYATAGKVAGSLLLGLYDEQGLLHHVGFTSSMAKADRASITKTLEERIEPPGFTGRAPGGPSRWSTDRSTQWEPLTPDLVVEVQYDHFTGERFRHGTKLLRWRPDKSPDQCTLAQLQYETNIGFNHLLSRGVL